MLVPTAENDRFRFFGGALLSIRAGAWIRAPTRLAVVGGRVDTRPYKALRFDTDRKFSILHSQFSIQPQGLGPNSYRKASIFQKDF